MSRRRPRERRDGIGRFITVVAAVVAIASVLPDTPPAAPEPQVDAGAVWTPPRTSGPGVDGQDGSFDDYVSALAPQMQDAVRQLDAAMGGGLRINSGYRTAGYQAELCERVDGPCAPPGRSLHQQGLAIDTPDHAAAASALAAHPEIPLCQPLPDRDAVHLSHADGREC